MELIEEDCYLINTTLEIGKMRGSKLISYDEEAEENEIYCEDNALLSVKEAMTRIINNFFREADPVDTELFDICLDGDVNYDVYLDDKGKRLTCKDIKCDTIYYKVLVYCTIQTVQSAPAYKIKSLQKFVRPSIKKELK